VWRRPPDGIPNRELGVIANAPPTPKAIAPVLVPALRPAPTAHVPVLSSLRVGAGAGQPWLRRFSGGDGIGRDDQRQVAECLGEVAYLALALDVVLLSEQAEVVRET
jgi:hypothetical protein